MQKKLVLFSMLLIIALVTAACGGDDAPESSTTDSSTTDSTSSSTESTSTDSSSSDSGDKIEVDGKIEAGESTTSDAGGAVGEFNEAPMLAEMVAAGELPPVDERLPVDYAIVETVDGIGEYGGTWHNVTWAADIPNIKMILYDPPIRWNETYTGYKPGLAKEFSWNDDGTQVTWIFREGLRWSDGEPFTTDDLKFWWENLANNDDYKLINVPWWGFNSDGSPMTVEFPDDTTMVMTWDKPQWITPYIVAQGFWEWEPIMKPRHYLEQFHPDITDGATYEDLELADKWWENPDYPTMFAWTTESYTPAERAVYVRNPYYWKVDPDGNQLPYIDRLDIAIIEDEQVRLLEASQGKYEASFRASTDPTQIPFLLEQAGENNYEVRTSFVNGAGGWPCWLINQNFSDESFDNWEEVGEVLRDKNFRKGVSQAMNRERLIDVAWGGIGIPQQATISPQAWHFASDEGRAVFEAWAAADAQYDPENAAALFEAAGVADADGDGIRDLPSGEPFQLILDLTDWGGDRLSIDATEAFQTDLEAAGFNVLVNNVMGTPENQLRQDEGLYMFRNCHASELDIWTFPDWIFPLRKNRAWPQEGKWRETGGEEGWEPEPGSPAARLQAIYDAGLAEPDVNERHKLVWDAIQIHIDEGPFTLGAAGDQPMPVVIGNNFHNVPEIGVLGPWAPGSPGNLHPEQFWISQ